jgi:hypothetical protein
VQITELIDFVSSQRQRDIDPELRDEILNRIMALSTAPQRDTKSAPAGASSLPSGESDPAVTPDCAGAGTAQVREALEFAALEAERCDTHALFCMADPTAIRRSIAERIRALSPPPADASADVRAVLEKIVSEYDRFERERLQLDEGVEPAINAARRALASLPKGSTTDEKGT